MPTQKTRKPETLLSPSLEHYLRAIYELIEEKGYARVTDIAHQLGVAKQHFDKATRDVATQAGIGFLDLRGTMPANKHDFAGAAQLTVAGNEKLAEALFQFLTARGFVD